jgi:ribonuclease P protein component
LFSKEEEEKENKSYLPNPKKKNTFPSSLKIQKREEFRLIYSKGEKHISNTFSLFILGNGYGKGRLGLTVTKRVGKAVERNRVKRIFREIFRKNKERINKNIDIVVHAKPEVVNKSYMEIEKEFLLMLDRLAKNNEK